MSQIELISFDFDGTLVVSNAIKRNSFFEAAKSLGDVSSFVENILSTEKGDRSVIWRRVVDDCEKEGLLPKDRSKNDWFEKLHKDYSDLCEKQISGAPEVKGALQTLKELKKSGYKLSINSATPEEALLPVVKNRGLEEYFELVLGGPDTKVQNFKKILSHQKSTPEKMLYVGDHKGDQKAAQDIGCHFIGVLNESASLSGEQNVIDDLSHFIGELKKYD